MRSFGIRVVTMCLCCLLSLLLSCTTARNEKGAQDKTDRMELAEALEKRLKRNWDPEELSVEVEHATVVLKGEVSSPAIARAMSIDAASTNGVDNVIVKLDVDPPERSDQQMQEAAMNALQAEPATRNQQIQTQVQAGRATLTGEVPSLRVKKIAEESVESIVGIRETINNLRIQRVTQTDLALRAKIARQIESNTAITAHPLYVKVSGARATITGPITSTRQKRLIEREASIPGIQAVDVRFEPPRVGASFKFRSVAVVDRPDEEVLEDVMARLALEPRVDADDIEVSVEDGVVTLEGSVETTIGKLEAEEAALLTLGVRLVDNQLRVLPSRFVTDPQMARFLNSLFENDVYLRDDEITVFVNEGVAHLSGFTDSAFEKARAAELALGVDGIIAVENNVAAGPSVGLSGEELAAEIVSDLFWDSILDSTDIDVEVDGNTARLSGTVDSAFERERAERLAENAGATVVFNNLLVTAPAE